MNIRNLLKDIKKPIDEDSIAYEANDRFTKLFGLEPSLFKLSLFIGKRETDLLTKKDIANVLLNNSLVDSLKEGLKEAEKLIKNQRCNPRFISYCDPNSEVSYYKLMRIDNPELTPLMSMYF